MPPGEYKILDRSTAAISDLSAPTVWQCLRSSWQPSPTGLSRLSANGHGTTCRTTWRPISVRDSKLARLRNRFPDYCLN